MTPIRYLSDDGICAIDVQLESGARWDTSNWDIISGYAKTILDECVARQQKGGSVRGFSKWVIPNRKPPTIHLRTSISFGKILALVSPLSHSVFYNILRLYD